ncbi:type IV pilus modification PilV family protein [Sodalis sp. RH25]
MPEALMAVLLFSLVALFMLHYLQRLANRQEDVRQYRQALTLSHQALEGYRLPSLRLYAGQCRGRNRARATGNAVRMVLFARGCEATWG